MIWNEEWIVTNMKTYSLLNFDLRVSGMIWNEEWIVTNMKTYSLLNFDLRVSGMIWNEEWIVTNMKTYSLLNLDLRVSGMIWNEDVPNSYSISVQLGLQPQCATMSCSSLSGGKKYFNYHFFFQIELSFLTWGIFAHKGVLVFPIQ